MELPLAVSDLRDYRLLEGFPFLGYLSACSTGANEANKAVDESIHLINTFQLAGFRHVVGTLWEVSDSHYVHVVRVLYETMAQEGITDKAVCLGLHKGVRALRDGHQNIKKSTDQLVDATKAENNASLIVPKASHSASNDEDVKAGSIAMKR